MKRLLLTAFLLAGFSVAAIAEEAADTPAAASETATAPDTEDHAVNITIGGDASDGDTAKEEKHGLSISINPDDEDADSAKEREIEERIEKKIEGLAERFFNDTTIHISEDEKVSLKSDLMELKKLDQDNEHEDDDSNDNDVVPFGAIVLGGLSIILIFGTPIMIVAGILYASYRKRRLIHDTINSYVATGKEIPPEVLQSFHEEAAPRRSNLHKGMVMVGIGAGIILCFMVMDVTELAALGAIPLFIGLAQLLIWKLESGGNGGKGGN